MIDRFQKQWEDPAARARILRWFWIVSTGFTLFGFTVMFYLIFVRR